MAEFIIPYAFRVSIANRIKFNVKKWKWPKYKKRFMRTLRKTLLKFMSSGKQAKMHANLVLRQIFRTFLFVLQVSFHFRWPQCPKSTYKINLSIWFGSFYIVSCSTTLSGSYTVHSITVWRLVIAFDQYNFYVFFSVFFSCFLCTFSVSCFYYIVIFIMHNVLLLLLLQRSLMYGTLTRAFVCVCICPLHSK